ncbi:RBM43 protein, partial [Quiscalus mexicanus]|nr:RBM43 protein [Quiscalus mexicanus]
QAGRGMRTVVIAGVPAGALQDDLLADLLTIHFQRSRNNGGDVEQVTYPTREAGVAYVTFEDAEVVQRVLKKDQHLLQDKRLPRPFPLTVTRYCHNVSSSLVSLSLLSSEGWDPSRAKNNLWLRQTSVSEAVRFMATQSAI